MKFYILILAGIIFSLSKGIKIKPELQRNILKFGYGINYKYEGYVSTLISQVLYSHKIHIAINSRHKIF